jgi:hypothetical protein
MTRTTPDFTSVAWPTNGTILFSALRIFSWVLPQALNEIDGASQHVLDAIFAGEMSSHRMRQVHGRRIVGVRLHDEAMRI